MNIGLVAHDTKKMLMQNFCIAYRGILARNELYATGTTGRLIEEVTNLNIHKFLAGHLGGEQQLGAQIEHNNIDLMIFLLCNMNVNILNVYFDIFAKCRYNISSNTICDLCRTGYSVRQKQLL